MKAKDSKIFLEALDELEKEKGISKESVLEAIELALLAAYKKNYGEDENVEVITAKSIGLYPLNTAGMNIFTIKATVTIKAKSAFKPFFFAITRTSATKIIPII